jgi:hypothetical protein
MKNNGVSKKPLKKNGSYSRCMHLRNMMAKSAALGQGVLAKK